MVFKGVLGAHGVFKVGVLVVQSKPSILREKLEVGIPPDWMTLCWGWNLWQECVSDFPTHFNVGIFSHNVGIEVYQLVSEFL